MNDFKECILKSVAKMLASTLTLTSSVIIFAQELEDLETVATDETISIEEIVVTAERPYMLLRNQIEFAKIDLYSSYNDLNEIEEFDVHCEDYEWTHTRIKTSMCLPEFFNNAMAEQTQIGLLTGDWFMLPPHQLANQQSRKFAELKSNILRVANSNPEVMKNLKSLVTLEQALIRKEERCKAQGGLFGIFKLCR